MTSRRRACGRAVQRADCQDDSGACLVLYRVWEKMWGLKVIFADSAYKRNGLPDWIKSSLGWVIQTVLRPVGLKGFVVLPKRWIVERTFALGWDGIDATIKITNGPSHRAKL